MKQRLPHALLLAGAGLALQLVPTPRAVAQSATTGPVRQAWIADYATVNTAVATGRKVATDAAGNVYTLADGLTNRAPTTSFVTSKYDPSGQLLWRNFYESFSGSSSVAADLAVDAAGNAYVTGTTPAPGTKATQFSTVKYSPAGAQLWVAQYPAPGNNAVQAIALDNAGNTYITGSLNGDYVTISYTAAGQQQWATRYDGGGADAATAVALDAAGNALVTGTSTNDYATVKYSPGGQALWVARYNGPGNGTDEARDLAVDAAGAVYVTGASPGTSGTDYATLKYDAAGQQQWVARFNDEGNKADVAYALALDATGNTYVTGQGVGADGRTEYATLKYDAAGQQQWVARYKDSSAQFPYGDAISRDIALDAQGNVSVTGNASSIGEYNQLITISYAQLATSATPAGCTPLATEPAVPSHALSTAVGTPLLIAPAYLLSGATDPLGRTLQVASVAQPSVGTLARNADGTYTYTPPAGFSGNATLGYVVQETGPVLASAATGHYYEFVSAPTTCWPAAQTAAAARTYRGMQGYLATITYQGEQDFVSGRQSGQYWFGATDAAVEGDWRWATGPEAGTLIWRGDASGYGLAYTHWLPGQPDDFKNQYRPFGEDYGLLYAESGYWNDIDACGSGTTVAGYLVEYGGLEACTPVLYTLGTLTITVGRAAQTAAARAAASGPAAAQAALGPATVFEATPNPSSGQFRVRLAAAQDGPAQLELFDIQGRRVRALYSGTLVAGETRELAVDGGSLAAGLYQLRLQSAEGTRTLRLSVQP